MRILHVSLLSCLLATGCRTGEASHLPSPFVWPFEAIRNGISNARYDAKRDKLKKHLEQKLVAFEEELRATPGAQFSRSLKLARIEEEKASSVFKRLQEDLEQNEKATPEQRVELYTITLMVHGDH